MRNGYHFQGRQQARKLPNALMGEVVTRNNGSLLLTEQCTWNECKLNLSTRNYWRASLVPAAAVIPAPIAYTKIVAVKTLVVELFGIAVGA